MSAMEEQIVADVGDALDLEEVCACQRACARARLP